jgi:hypothetical protein
VQVGKVAPHLKGCFIPYGCKERFFDDCEVLCGDAGKLRWVEVRSRCQPKGWVPVEAGHEKDGSKLWVARILEGDAELVGKVGSHFKTGIVYGYGMEEKYARDGEVYQVLALP